MCVENEDSLYQFFNSKSVEQDDIEDLVQKTFVLLWVKRQKIRIHKFVNFMFGVARKLIFKYRRERYKKASLEKRIQQNQIESRNKQHNDPIREILSREDATILSDAVNKLPRQMQKVIRLVYFEGYSPGEAAKIMKIALPTVYGHERKARSLLARKFSEFRRDKIKKAEIYIQLAAMEIVIDADINRMADDNA